MKSKRQYSPEQEAYLKATVCVDTAKQAYHEARQHERLGERLAAAFDAEDMDGADSVALREIQLEDATGLRTALDQQREAGKMLLDWGQRQFQTLAQYQQHRTELDRLFCALGKFPHLYAKVVDLCLRIRT